MIPAMLTLQMTKPRHPRGATVRLAPYWLPQSKPTLVVSLRDTRSTSGSRAMELEQRLVHQAGQQCLRSRNPLRHRPLLGTPGFVSTTICCRGFCSPKPRSTCLRLDTVAGCRGHIQRRRGGSFPYRFRLLQQEDFGESEGSPVRRVCGHPDSWVCMAGLRMVMIQHNFYKQRGTQTFQLGKASSNCLEESIKPIIARNCLGKCFLLYVLHPYYQTIQNTNPPRQTASATKYLLRAVKPIPMQVQAHV